VILMYTLPPALLVPWWHPTDSKPPMGSWYGGVLAALCLGAAIALAWALAAAAAGGEQYGNAILWGQTAGRLKHSPAHQEPWWWYFPLLPAMLLPWSLWTPLWRGPWRRPLGRGAWALRFCIACSLPTFLIFCFVSAKQPHYLLPLLPFAALLLAHRATRTGLDLRRHALWAGLLWMLLGAALIILPQVCARRPELLALPDWVAALPVWLGALVFAAGALAVFLRPRSLPSAVVLLGSLAPTLILSIHLFGVPVAAAAYDLTEISRRVGVLERSGVPVAIRRKYQDQFHFLGRLEKPLDAIELDEVEPWFQEHPEGRFIAVHRFGLPPGGRPEYSQLYRGGWIAIWDRAGTLAHPEITTE